MNCCRFGNGQGSIFRKSDGKYGKNILRLLLKLFFIIVIYAINKGKS